MTEAGIISKGLSFILIPFQADACPILIAPDGRRALIARVSMPVVAAVIMMLPGPIDHAHYIASLAARKWFAASLTLLQAGWNSSFASLPCHASFGSPRAADTSCSIH